MDSEKTLPVINPATGTLVREHRAIDSAEIQDRIEAAHNAFLDWRRVPFAERANVLKEAADLLDSPAKTATPRGSPPRWASRSDKHGPKSINARGSAATMPKRAKACSPTERIPLEKTEARLVACPLGVIYAIMPWNFPFWQAFRAAAPALMAGNAMLLKGAPNVPGCSADIAQIFHEAGAPAGLFGDLPMDVAESPAVIAHPLVRGVTLTGSERAGRAVATEAGANLKKCVLELGGSDPYLILEDADLQLAAQRCATSRMLCAGQVCIAAKRLIAVDGIYDRFRDLLLAELEPYAMADPAESDCRLGPLAREDLRDTVHAQVNASVTAGADLILGGSASCA